MHPSVKIVDKRGIVTRLRKKVRHILICEPTAANGRTDITDKASRVVVQPSAATDVARKGAIRIHRAKIDAHICKRAIVNAAAAGARRHIDDQGGDEGHCVGEIPVRNRYAVAREGVCGTIEEG